MGYLEDLRAQKAREEAARTAQPPSEKQVTKGGEYRQIISWGQARLEQSGVSEVIGLLGAHVAPYARTYQDGSASYEAKVSLTDGSYVTVEPDDRGFTIYGSDKQRITNEQISLDPDAVTDALGKAVANPHKPQPINEGFSSSNDPQPEPHDYSR